MPTARRRLLSCAVLVGVFIVVGLCAGMGALLLRLRSGSSERLDVALAELKTRGEPTSLADLEPPPIDGEDDGAPTLRNAWAWLGANTDLLDESPAEWSLSDDEYAALSNEARAEDRERIAALAPFLALVCEAVEHDEVRVWAETTTIPAELPDIRSIQVTERVLGAAIRASSDPAETVRLLRAKGLFGVRLRHPTIAVHTLVVLTIHARALGDVRGALEAGDVAARDLRIALEPVLDAGAMPLVRSMIRAERVQHVALVRTILGDEATVPEYDGPVTGRSWVSRLSRAALGDFADETQVVLDASHGSWRDLARASVEFGQQGRDARLLAAVANVTAGARVLVPRIVVKGAELDAVRALGRLSIAAASDFETSGAWPGALADIDVEPAVRLDPFTGSAFTFERLPDGVRISSPGPTDPEVWGERAVARNDPEADGLVWTLRR